MIKFSQLESFVVVVECGSINKAAEKLFVTQPTLSRVLKSLEDEMGKQLLYRKNQGVIPTKEGKILYRYAQSILDELKVINNLKKKNIDELFTELNISVYSLFIKEEIFAEFKNSYKLSEISLNIDEVTLEKLIDNVYTGASELGIAVVNDIELPLIQKNAQAKRIKILPLDVSPLYVHMGKKHPFYDKDTIVLKEMLPTTYLHLPFDLYSTLRLGMAIDDVVIKDFHRSLTINNYRIIKSILKSTDCFLFGNKWQIEELEKEGICSKQIQNCNVEMHLILMINERIDALSSETKYFIELIDKYYKNV